MPSFVNKISTKSKKKKKLNRTLDGEEGRAGAEGCGEKRSKRDGQIISAAKKSF